MNAHQKKHASFGATRTFHVFTLLVLSVLGRYILNLPWLWSVVFNSVVWLGSNILWTKHFNFLVMVNLIVRVKRNAFSIIKCAIGRALDKQCRHRKQETIPSGRSSLERTKDRIDIEEMTERCMMRSSWMLLGLPSALFVAAAISSVFINANLQSILYFAFFHLCGAILGIWMAHHKMIWPIPMEFRSSGLEC